MKVMQLTYKGRNSWDRPVYSSDGILYVDIDPRSEYPNICTKANNEFDDEPDYPIGEDVKLEFIHFRDRW